MSSGRSPTPAPKPCFTPSSLLHRSSFTRPCHARPAAREVRHAQYARQGRQVVRAGSLEDAKKKARSPYDNIPDMNQRYIAELAWAERKFGPQVVRKNITKEAQKSILRPEGVVVPRIPETRPVAEGEEGEVDLSGYRRLRRQLIGDTLFVGALGTCAAWGIGDLKVVLSYLVGVAGSFVYLLLLSRSVDRLADGARGGQPGADALQPARVAILVLLVLATAKNKDTLDVLPVLFGFFTYKIATLLPLLSGEAFEGIQ